MNLCWSAMIRKEHINLDPSPRHLNSIILDSLFSYTLLEVAFNLNRIHLVLNIYSFLPHIWCIWAWQAMHQGIKTLFQAKTLRPGSDTNSIVTGKESITSLNSHVSFTSQSCCKDPVKLCNSSLRYKVYLLWRWSSILETYSEILV